MKPKASHLFTLGCLSFHDGYANQPPSPFGHCTTLSDNTRFGNVPKNKANRIPHFAAPTEGSPTKRNSNLASHREPHPNGDRLNQITETVIPSTLKPLSLSAEIVVITGAPGAGKGTICQGLINDNPAFGHISIGEEVRRVLRDPEHPITKSYGDQVARGELLPDAVVRDILKVSLVRADQSSKVILLDGYPRNLSQLAELKDLVGGKLTLVVLDVSDASAVDRITHRGMQRADDKVETARKRIELFHRETVPMIKQMKSTNTIALVQLNTAAQHPRESVATTIRKNTHAIQEQLLQLQDIQNALAKPDN
jgi:adenylate kinase